jgi:hypothetical protein
VCRKPWLGAEFRAALDETVERLAAMRGRAPVASNGRALVRSPATAYWLAAGAIIAS